MSDEVEDGDGGLGVHGGVHDHIVCGGVRIDAVDHILGLVLAALRNADHFGVGDHLHDVDVVVGGRGLGGVAAPVETDFIVGLVAEPEFARVGGLVGAEGEDVLRGRVGEVFHRIGQFVYHLMPVAFINIVVAHIDASEIIGLAIFVGLVARSAPGAGHVAQRVDGEGRHARCAATHFVEVVVLSVEHILVVFNEVAVVIDISWHESNPLGGVGRSDHIARVLRVGLPKRQGVVRVAIVGFDGTILGVVPIVDTVNGEAAPSGVGVTDFRVDVGVGSQSHVGNAIGANGDNGITVPAYADENVSTKVVKIIQSYTGIVNKMIWRKL